MAKIMQDLTVGGNIPSTASQVVKSNNNAISTNINKNVSNADFGFNSIGSLAKMFTGNAFDNSAFNAAEAQKNRDFQERMSNTAYQRMVKDLQRAGLNPILATHSGGATTPSGATASADTSSNSAIAGIISSAMNMMSAQTVAQIYTSASLMQTMMNNETSKFISNNQLTNDQWKTQFSGELQKTIKGMDNDTAKWIAELQSDTSKANSWRQLFGTLGAPLISALAYDGKAKFNASKAISAYLNR